METGNSLLDKAFADSERTQSTLHEILFGKKVNPFGGEVEDDGFITAYSSIPILR